MASSPANQRNRKPISCNLCRQRKMRCDRALPVCGSCIRRGDVAECSYQSDRFGIRKSWTLPASTSHSSDDVQSRLSRLEYLLLTVIEENSSCSRVLNGDDCKRTLDGGHVNEMTSKNPLADSPSQPAKEAMQEGLHGTKQSTIRTDTEYTRSFPVAISHWEALLNEVSEVRTYLQEKQECYEEESRRIAALVQRSPSDFGRPMIFCSGRCTRAEVLAQLPSKDICDVLVRKYFATIDPALSSLHAATFWREYAEHWNNAEKSSILWIGLLFGVMRIAILTWERDGDDFEQEMSYRQYPTLFQAVVANCLILADYMRPQDHLIETFLVHLSAEFLSSPDINSHIWTLWGLAIRLAMRMGYHRDPEFLLHVSPFQAEMRRRLWAFITQADILFSFQIGLPSMVKISNSDVGLPRNLYDEQLHEDRASLPPSLPSSEATPVAYLINKTRLVRAFAKVLKEANRKDIMPYERVLELDKGLRQLYAHIPDMYKMRPMVAQQEDSLQLVRSRFVLAATHYKSLCILHSRFLHHAQRSPQYMYSRRVCLESAMSLLRFQAVQQQELAIGGRLSKLSRYQTSLTSHDYLLAATILCAEISLSLKSQCDPYPYSGEPRIEAMLEAIERSANIWSQIRDQSIEAYKASDVLGMLARKFRCIETKQTDEARLAMSLPIAEASLPGSIAASTATPNAQPRLRYEQTQRETTPADPSTDSSFASRAELDIFEGDLALPLEEQDVMSDWANLTSFDFTDPFLFLSSLNANEDQA